MNKKYNISVQLLVFVFFFLGFVTSNYAQSEIGKEIEYVSPKPFSVYNFPSTNIIIKYNTELISNQNTLKKMYEIRCNGRFIPFKLVQTAKNTVILKPVYDLPPNEKIIVKQVKSLDLAGKAVAKSFSYFFQTTHDLKIGFVDNTGLKAEIDKKLKEASALQELGTSIPSAIDQKIAKQIPIVVRANNLNGEKRFYFTTTINYQLSTKNRMMIINEEGKVLFERFTPNYCLDFKQLAPNRFSYYDWKDTCYYILNEQFATIDTVKAGNGMVTDNHELKYNPQTGNYWLIAQQVVEMDLSEVVIGGQQDARVLGMVFQEITPNKEVVFEWKSLDYIPVRDAVGVDLTSPGIIDYMHSNSIDLESDTSILISSRHLNEITRVNIIDGSIIWRMGFNSVNKSFRFVNDPEGFTYQHDARRLSNGNILLFDNGNFKIGERYSRAIEYHIDDKNLVATKVWEYKSDEVIVSDFMGSVQRLPNGNTVIGWGGTIPTFTEVNSDGVKVFEATTPLWSVSYRAYHFDVENILRNMSIQNSLSDTIEFCNEDSSSILLNINNWIRANFNADTPDSLIQSKFSSSKDFNILTWNPINGNDIYSYSKHQIHFNYAKLNQNDTNICYGTRIFHVSVDNNCSNIEYLWSTGSTESFINIDPSLSTSQTYWVRIGNAQFSNIDSFHLEISKLPAYDIFGKESFDKPFEIATYSVPFDPSFQYSWKVINGNIISGYGTNAIQVQWGRSDSSLLYSTITNQFGCSNSAKYAVQLPSSTNGLSELNEINMNVYPNPFTNKLSISVKEKGELNIIDALGKLIIHQNVNTNELVELDTDYLKAGTYIVQLKTDKGIQNLKMLKMK